MKSSRSVPKAFLNTLILSVGMFALGVPLYTPPAFAQRVDSTAQSVADRTETYRLLNLFGDVFERVREQYVEPVTDKQLIETAINGMLTSLDPHSGYLDTEGFKDIQVQTKGEFGGLGIEVTMENGVVKVVTPIDDTPAFRAGLLAGDYITHLDKKPVTGMTLNEAVDKMRGKIGEPIVITIFREGATEPFDVTLVRDKIQIQSVRSRAEGNVGYLRVTSFTEQTGPALNAAIAKLQKDIGKDLAGFVLDLRNNPGGLLDQAIAVSDTFLDKGEIVSTRGRDPKDSTRFNAKEGDLTNGLPVVVLINGGSASAAEIVAGALQDHRRAIVLGQDSFGKGSVQTIIPLSSTGAIKLTTARYYTPSGRSIQAKGIVPDIEVKPAHVEVLNAPLYSTKEADLKGALSNPNADGDAKPAVPPVIIPPTDPATDKPDADGKAPAATDGKTDVNGKANPDGTPAGIPQTANTTPEKPPEEDYQLSRAVDLIRGLSLFQQGKESTP